VSSSTPLVCNMPSDGTGNVACVGWELTDNDLYWYTIL
jgi:hypothetical protein